MEENEKKEVKAQNFKTVQNPNTYKTVFKNETAPKAKIGFTRGVLLPFFCGVVGSTVVLGTCFGIPSIRSKLFNKSSTIINNTSNSENSGYVSQTSLSNYSDTSVYAANKVLPSIVGIEVEYNVNNSFMSMFGKQSTPSTAKASGSGIIISEDGYILTNNHIVATSSSESYYEVSSATKVTVTLFND